MSRITPIQQRINDKKVELENLSQIRDFTEILTNQLEQLEDKLSTMADGTEAVALVLSNWQNIIKSISLASMGLMKYTEQDYESGATAPLPETLVRIRLNQDDPQQPTEHTDQVMED